MSVESTATMSQSHGQGDEAAVFANTGATAGLPSSAEIRAPNSTAGQASSGTQSEERHGGRSLQDDGTERLKQTRSVLNEVADEEAFRLRSGGMTYRQIGEQMGVDQSMAHRRVKRQMMRQKMYLDEKLEEARDFELDKLRQMEQAILPDATSGDHSAIKLVLRIMEMRRKLLKDIPLEHGDAMPSIEDRAEMLAEVVDAEWERKGRPGEEAEPSESGSCEEQVEEEYRISSKEQGMSKEGAEATVDGETAALFARLFTDAAEAVTQQRAEERVTANEAASTDGSTSQSTAASKDQSMEVKGTEAEGKGGQTNGAWRAY